MQQAFHVYACHCLVAENANTQPLCRIFIVDRSMMSTPVLYLSYRLLFRSFSMALTDHQPLSDAPVTSRIRAHAPNRLGAVYSALYCFWSARHAAATATQETLGARFANGAFYSTLHTFLTGRHASVNPIVDQQTTDTRRDAYSIVLFNHVTKNALVNDLTSSPDQLLGALLGEQAVGGTDFSSALRAGEAIMVENWSPERLVTQCLLFCFFLTH